MTEKLHVRSIRAGCYSELIICMSKESSGARGKQVKQATNHFPSVSWLGANSNQSTYLYISRVWLTRVCTSEDALGQETNQTLRALPSCTCIRGNLLKSQVNTSAVNTFSSSSSSTLCK